MKSKVLGCLLAMVVVLASSSCLHARTLKPQPTKAPLRTRTSAAAKSAATARPSPTAEPAYVALDAAATPPGDGFYLAVKGAPVQLSSVGVNYLDSSLYSTQRIGLTSLDIAELGNTPSTPNRTPVTLLQLSAEASPHWSWSGLALLRLEFGLGVQLMEGGGQCVVSWVSEGSAAQMAGLAQGDMILAADGQDCGGSCDTVRQRVTGRPGETVRLSVLRGTRTMDVTAVRRTVVGAVAIPYRYAPKGSYVQLMPRQPLSPGLYCWLYQGVVDAIFPFAVE